MRDHEPTEHVEGVPCTHARTVCAGEYMRHLVLVFANVSLCLNVRARVCVYMCACVRICMCLAQASTCVI